MSQGRNQNRKQEAKPEPSKPPIVEKYLDRDGDVKLTVHGEEQNIAFQQLLAEWEGCERCPLSATRHHVTFVRGKLPADVLFIGEAPGPKEDEYGFPFVGPSGRLLTTMIRELQSSRNGWSFAIANPVGCIPWERPKEEGQEPDKFRQPEPYEIKKCSPRFLKIVELVNPTGIILLGKVAEQFWNDHGEDIQQQLGRTFKTTKTHHPAYLLRRGGAREGNMDYKTALSGLRFFLFQTLKLGS